MKEIKNQFTLILILLFCSLSSVKATNYYVNDNSTVGDTWCSAVGNDANNGTSTSTPKATIADVFADYSINSGDIIYVDKGTYTEDEVLPYSSDDDGFTVIGAGKTSTYFDGASSGSRFMNVQNSNGTLTFQDLTFQNYDETGDGGVFDIGDGDGNLTCTDVNFTDCNVSTLGSGGGAIATYIDVTVTLTDCAFTNCDTDNDNIDYGGAIYMYGSSSGGVLVATGCTFTTNSGGEGGAIHVDAITTNNVTLTSCVFNGNSSTYATYPDGGAAHLSNIDGTVTVDKCKFYGNTAVDGGGALYLDVDGTCTIKNSLFYENTATAGDGGALFYYCASTAHTITNCTFADNVAGDDGGGVMLSSLGVLDVTAKNSIFYNNTATGAVEDDFDAASEEADFINCSYTSTDDIDLSGGTDTSPQTGDPTFTNAASDDYSLGSGSNCIDNGTDTGAPADDIDGTSRSTTDIGCYERDPLTWTGATSTAWLTTTNWSTGVVPTSSDSPVIPDVTNQPIITSVVTLTGLTIDAGSEITISTNSLTCTGSVDMNGTMDIDNATVNADGAFDATSGTIDFTHASGKLILSDAVTSLGTLDAATGTVEYDDADAQTIFGDTYNNLEIDGDATGDKTAGGAVTVNGTFTLTANAERYVCDAYTTTVTGATDINSELKLDNASSVFDANGTFDATGAVIDFDNATAVLQLSSTVTSLGTLDAAVGVVEYDGGTQSVLADAYFDLKIDQAGVKTSAGTVTVAGALTVESTATYALAATTTTTTGVTDMDGTVTISTGVYNADGDFDGTGGTIDFTGAGKLILSSTVTSLGTLDAATGTVEYDDADAQTIFGDTYNNLEIDGDATGDKTAGGAVTVNGTFTATANAERYVCGAYTTTVTGATDINSELKLDNASSIFDANGTFDATGAIIDFDNAAARLRMSSTVTSLGTLDAAVGIVEYDGGTQSVLVDAYFDLEIDQAGTKTAVGAITAAGTLTVQSGATYALDATTTTVSGATDLNGTLTISTGVLNADADFDGTGGTIDFTGAGKLILSSTSTSLGTLDIVAGTVEYDGTTQTILSDNYFNLEIDAAGTKTAGGNLNIDGDLTTSATATCKIDMSTYDLNVAGDLNIGVAEGSDFSNASCLVTFDGSTDQNLTHAGNSATQAGYVLVNYDFESDDEGFTTGGSIGSFSRTNSLGNFETGNTGYAMHYTHDDYANSSDGYVTSPSINMTDMNTMTLSVNVRYNTESSWDGMTIKYSTGGAYTTIGSTVTGTNWYNDTDVDGLADAQDGWSGDNTAWETATIPIPGGLEGESAVTFRVYFGSDGSDVDDGASFDDFKITGTYTGGSGSELTAVTINNSGGNVVLASTVTIDGVLTMTSGDIDASSFDLDFADAGSTTGGSGTSFVTGTATKTTESTTKFTFPMGAGANYRPLSITPDATSTTTWSVDYFNAAYSDLSCEAGLNNVSHQEYWDLTRATGTADAVVEMTWIAANGVEDYTDLTIAHYNSGTSNWETVTSTPTGTNTSGTLVSTAAQTSFSPYAPASKTGNVTLPVSLIDFTVSCEGEEVVLEWITASEINNDYFLVEKAFEDGDYTFLTEVSGNGTTSENSFYTVSDSKSSSDAFYRLSQFDHDGQSEVLKVISSTCSIDSEKEELTFEVKPNMFGSFISIHSSIEASQFYKVKIMDTNGKQMYLGDHFTVDGSVSDQIQVHDLANGVYFVSIVVNGIQSTQKVLWSK